MHEAPNIELYLNTSSSALEVCFTPGMQKRYVPSVDIQYSRAND